MSKEYVERVVNLKPGEQPPPGAKLVAVRQFQGCIVCGADSNLRCSSCAAHGLDWMKFCSAKCQKEVWFLHKRVCGAKAVPFRWPGLTKAELEDMEGISKRDHKDRLRSKKEAKLHRKGLIPSYESIRKEGLSNFLDPGKDKKLPEEMDRKIVELRNVEFQTRTLGIFTAETSRMDGFIKGKKAICHNPFNFMIYLQEAYFPGLAMGFPNEKEKPFWWDMFQHQFVIYYATLVHAYDDPKKSYDHAPK
ncbi:hypothetical protein JCM5353_007855 [Sporobolomyces roseus]